MKKTKMAAVAIAAVLTLGISAAVGAAGIGEAVTDNTLCPYGYECQNDHHGLRLHDGSCIDNEVCVQRNVNTGSHHGGGHHGANRGCR